MSITNGQGTDVFPAFASLHSCFYIALGIIVAYKRQDMPSSGAFSSSSERKGAGVLWQWQHPPHSTREDQSLRASYRTVMPPRDLPMVSWPVSYFCSHSRRRGQPRSRQTWKPSLDIESSATHNAERAGWKSLVSSHMTVQPRVHLSETWSA